jgi:glycosyltransferase involved in cell wall biosynthesis
MNRLPERIRVAFCIDSFGIGGTELNAVRTAEALDPSRFELLVVHLQESGPLRSRYENLGVSMRRVKIRNLYSPASLRAGAALGRSLREWGAHVVHTHDLYTNIFVTPWARTLGRCGVLASRRWAYEAPRRALVHANRLSYRFAHQVLANSASVVRLLRDDECIPERKIVHIPNFIAESAFETISDADRAQQRESWGVPANAFVIGSVARLSKVKNHGMMLRALKILEGDVIAVLIGDGPERAPLEQLAHDLGVSRRVRFVGEVISADNLHRCFDVSVLCSHSEGFPNTVVEGLAAARPIVATSVGGVADVIDDGLSGLLIPDNDHLELAAAIGKLRSDAAFARTMAERGQAVARRRFARAKVISVLCDTYERLAAIAAP